MFFTRTLFIFALLSSLTVSAQESKEEYLKKINKELPHQFKELRIGATMEAVREQGVVRVFLLVDDIEQYDELLIERSDEHGTNYAQCKSVTVVKGKYKNNYVEVVDQYPLSPKVTPQYRLKAITPEGITRMFAPVVVVTKE